MGQMLRERREEILRTAAQHGVLDVKVLGSVARGEAHPDSDIDVLGTREPGRSLLDLIALKHELEDLLGHRVDVVTRPAISPYLCDQILSETVDL
ncbi:MAG: nucleotidyltransferase family protein [Chloroflexi bacterium]|nr:nucleotidyltransferase family protein [Chloroflexota bacterium]